MGADTAISWCDATFSPWWGCARVSEGCQHCYAETFSHRVGDDVWGKGKPRRAIGDKMWNEPLRWDREAANEGVTRRVFSASMCDVFEDHDGPMVDHHGNGLPGRSVAQERERLFELIAATPNLRWLLLTKRPQNVARMVPSGWMASQEVRPADQDGPARIVYGWPFNVWIGTTTEHQEAANERIPHLLALPAPVRFLSYEPGLGPLDLSRWLVPQANVCQARDGSDESRAAIGTLLRTVGKALGGHYVDWVIAGGESGPKRRPYDLGWARSVRDQCEAAGVAFFFKQDAGLKAGTHGPPDLDSCKTHPVAP